jgi:hypothetical protein
MLAPMDPEILRRHLDEAEEHVAQGVRHVGGDKTLWEREHP